MSTCIYCGRFVGRDMKHRHEPGRECFACRNMCWSRRGTGCDEAARERREALAFWRAVCMGHADAFEGYGDHVGAGVLRRWAREAT